jgi:hypothetical protein
VYRQTNLDRKESIDGSILFEVPDNMHPSDAYLSVDIESVLERPVWGLG